MKAILTLLKENIRYKKGAFRSIIALMAIITLSFSVTLSDNDNISRELNSALERLTRPISFRSFPKKDLMKKL